MVSRLYHYSIGAELVLGWSREVCSLGLEEPEGLLLENNDSKLVKGRPEAGESKWVWGRVIRGSVDLVCFI